MRSDHSAVITKWAKIYDAHFTHSSIPEERGAMIRALRDINPSDLEDACLRAYQECQYYPKVSDIRSRVERRHEQQGKPTKELFLRSARGQCYAGSSIDGKYAVEDEKVNGHYTGVRLRYIMRCGCKVCDPIDWQEWEEKNLRYRPKPPVEQPKPELVKAMTPVASIQSPAPETQWWEDEEPEQPSEK